MSIEYSQEVLNALGRLVPVISTDHPLSQGRSLYVLSAHPAASASIAVSKEIESLFCSDSGGLLRFDDDSFKVIMALGHDTGRIRLIELIAHESSHYVDHLFQSCKVDYDTEIRAHYLDWVVGKVASEFSNLLDDAGACPSRSNVSAWPTFEGQQNRVT